MKSARVAIFGQSDRGKLCFFTPVDSLVDLSTKIGNPEGESLGVYLAVQTLMYQEELLFYRVSEEGLDQASYMHGLNQLTEGLSPCPIKAISLPGVIDQNILAHAAKAAKACQSLLLMNEQDLFDFVTS